MNALTNVYVFAESVQFDAMAQTWRDRLQEAIDEADISYRQLSLDSGLGPSYVSELFKEGREKEPTVSNLIRIADTLNVSIAWLLTGIRMSGDAERLVSEYMSMDDEDRQMMVRMFERLSSQREERAASAVLDKRSATVSPQPAQASSKVRPGS